MPFYDFDRFTQYRPLDIIIYTVMTTYRQERAETAVKNKFSYAEQEWRIIMRKKRWMGMALALALFAGTFSACAEQAAENSDVGLEDANGQTVKTEDADKLDPGQEEGNAESSAVEKKEPVVIGDRPLFCGSTLLEEVSVVPCVEVYTISPDLSNIDNLWQFYLQDEMADKLSKNGFVVCGNSGNEFFEQYEENRYNMIPNFVTVDSLMHTYHLYFGYLLKNLERDSLSEDLLQLSRRMLSGSQEQYDRLKGSEWESAARRNVVFFSVGTKLLDGSTQVCDYAEETAGQELERIESAKEILESELTGGMEDYTQYIPRGYYEGDEKLESYFRAMMWYGRVHFKQQDEDLDRSALLISKAMLDDSEAYELWSRLYAVTSFFAGASDDLGVCEYAPLIREVYGEDLEISDLTGKEEKFASFHARTADLPAPQINSIPIWDGQENVIQGFRFMGQRFTIDGAVMQKLIYSDVKENAEGQKRMLPDVLDVPAALGSDAALAILEESGAAEFAGYRENMERLREALEKENDDLWSASLYAGWLNTLRPLLTVKEEGYPVFMQNDEWLKKNLECFAGSFTELKHDTVLYTKQVLAEMGGDYIEEVDDRGYVEPEPLVYLRFRQLAEQTAQGLEYYGMLSDAERDNLSRLSEIARRLWTISQKELEDEVLSEEEYDFIRGYGGNIEHFWYEAMKEASEDGSPATKECPAAIVVDIATNPNGQVLEAGTGNPSYIYVVVKVDGKLKIARGSVYSFYQFVWPMEDRLTDDKWRRMLGIQVGEDGFFEQDLSVSKPQWTESYRYKYEWEY